MHGLEGILVVDKPQGMTSHDVVAKLRRRFKMKRIGHAGTLDPDATGLLIICLGRATKVSSYLMDGEKTYRVGFTLGQVTDTYDSTGKVLEQSSVGVSETQLREAISTFEGKQMQVPPPFSAVKVKGRKLYEYARKDQVVEVPAREIEVKEFKLQSYTCPTGSLKIICSKGTYVRALVHDLGKRLGVGGVTTSIRRVQSGNLTLDHAMELSRIVDENLSLEEVAANIIPIAQAVSTLPQFKVSALDSVERLRHGMALSPTEVKAGTWLSKAATAEHPVLVVNEAREAIALTVLTPDLSLRVSRVI